jgi:prophage antirepressor-like protein
VPQVFNFEGQELPIVLIEGEPYFDRNAACQILGIKEAHRVMERLSVKGCHQVTVLTKGGKQLKTFIDERNLYRLIGRSDKPQAIKFMDWVYDEVLPSIRKTGSYSAPGAQDNQDQ